MPAFSAGSSRWLVVTDELGTALVVKSEPHDLTFFRMSSAAKRWTDGELSWIMPFVDFAAAEVSRVRFA